MNMKAKTLLTACLFMLAVGANAANDGKAILHHDKKPTAIYDADKLSDALNAAVAGDTIYLSAGIFPSFTLEKAITIKGAGTNTNISSGVAINIPDNPTITSALLDAVNVLGAVTVNSDITDFLIKSVQCVSMTFNGNFPNALIDRCCITGTFNVAETMTDFYVRNSHVGYCYSPDWKYNKCTFVNCYFPKLESSGRFIGCMIGAEDNNSRFIHSSIFSYCLINSRYVTIAPSSYTEHCYYHTNSWVSADVCKQNNWLGQDGYPVGNQGGKTPFNLNPSGPKETNSSINVDDKEKKLNVTLTVSPK